MQLHFGNPLALALLALAVPLVILAWRSVRVLSTGTVVQGLALRITVLALLVTALAEPFIARISDATALIVITDASASVPASVRDPALAAVGAAAARRKDGDRVGVVTYAERPEVRALPSDAMPESFVAHAGAATASDAASAIRMALAVAPADAATRILLVSDGNSTGGDAIEAASLASAAGIPVDVVPVRFSHEREVVVDRLASPARVREGQAFDLRLAIRATHPVAGRVSVRQNGLPVDLDPASNGESLRVELDAGANLVAIPAVADGTGAQRFEVRFEPDAAADDAVEANNVGATVTFVGGAGRVAVIEPAAGTESAAFLEALRRGGIEAESVTPDGAMQRGIAWLAGQDAVFLMNVPRWSVDNALDRDLHAYAHDLGGGLVMVGGPESFGAGGWNGSEVAKAMPVRMDPPQTRMLLRVSVALVIDRSGSMAAPVANTAQSQQEMANAAAMAGLRSLSRADEACVIAFDTRADLVVPRGPIGDMRGFEPAVRGIAPGGGTDQFAGMELALAELKRSRAQTKHMVVLTDGQTQGTPEEGTELALAAKAAGITISTIGIGDGANDQLLRTIARVGGGRFHAIKSFETSRKLPQVFIREVATEGRALIEEGRFEPAMVPLAGGPLAGIDRLPPVRGYVIVAPREGLSQVGAAVRTKDGADPFIAWHNYGIGRGVALAGDLTARWAAEWRGWGGFQPFCERLARWTMRPADDRSIEPSIDLEGELATLRVTLSPDRVATASRVDGRLVSPGGEVRTLAMRQVAPTRFEASFEAAEAGAYLASVVAVRGGDDGAVRASSAHASLSVPYPREFRAVRDDAAALSAIADRSGGRVIEVGQLPAVDLFDRSGLAPSKELRLVWDLLAIAAAVVLVADVAWRRMAFGRQDAAELAAIMTAGSAVAKRAGVSAPEQPAGPAKPAQRGQDDAPQEDPLSRLRRARRRASDRG